MVTDNGLDHEDDPSLLSVAMALTWYKRWMQRAPAMAEGLVDHIWTIRELLTFRVPFQ